MKNSITPGKIIIINGPSSSGKTTLSLALQKQISIPFIRFSFDLFIENKVLPREQIDWGKFSWPSMRPAVFDGLHRCVPALASAGNNVIFDHIIETEGWLHDLVRYLADFDIFFVGLHCSIEELERRETQRGDRRIGEARADSQIVHSFSTYDLELNSENPVEENARILIGEWEKRIRPSAFEKMSV
jgi:chloramphenicol 3-O phosphotransferase